MAFLANSLLLRARGSRSAGVAPEPANGRSQDELPDESVMRVLPGEFERHDALLMCWPDRDDLTIEGLDAKRLNENARATILKVAEHVRQNIQVVLVVESQDARRRAIAALQRRKIPLESIRIIQTKHNSCWVRDYGPLVLRTPEGPLWLSSFKMKRLLLNPANHLFPHALGRRFGVPVRDIPLYLEGGNLITNGRGLYVATNQVLADNLQLGFSPDDVTALMTKHLGAKQVVFLEPLVGELTGHVDIFATFPRPDTIVLGQYSPEDDPVNRDVLERNAKALRAVKTEQGPLKVVRIPMAPRGEQVFGGSYTNVIYANGVCLVPSYRKLDPEGLSKAMAIYRRLLPGWKVVDVDAVEWIIQQGALHCLTLHLYRLPDTVDGRSAFDEQRSR